jgi:PAS domain S-box-containing protein
MNNSTNFIGSIEPYRQFFEEMDDIMMIVTEQGTIEYVNRALRNRFGLKKKRFTGKNIRECRLFEKGMNTKKMLQMIFESPAFLTEVKSSDDNTNYFAWRTKVFSHQGKKKAMAVVRDMTQEISLQREVEDNSSHLEEIVLQRTQQLEREKQKALELQQTKVTFLSRMSHELRTPLTAIRGYAELLQDPSIEENIRQKYLGVIERNTTRLLQMIDETLQIIRLQQEQYRINEKFFSLKDLLSELVETYTVLTQEKGLKLEYDIPDDMPDSVYSDPSVIRQVLTNLIGNAIKFTQEGNISLTVRQRVNPGRGMTKLFFTVTDTGSGIPEEHRRRIFKSFVQYLDHQPVHRQGTGLGLPICRHMAKLLAGDVRLLSSEIYKGSSFIFSLPIRNKKNRKK